MRTGEEAETHAELAKAQEYTVDDCKARHVVLEGGICARHDEAEEGLCQEARDHGVFGPEVVDGERPNKRARHVEQAVA